MGVPVGVRRDARSLPLKEGLVGVAGSADVEATAVMMEKKGGMEDGEWRNGGWEKEEIDRDGLKGLRSN